MIYRDTIGGAQALAAGVYQKLTVLGQANGPSSGVTPSFALNRLTFPTTGVYLVYFQLSYRYAPSGQISMRVYLNGVTPVPQISATSLTFAFFPNSIASENLVSLTAGDFLEIFLNPTLAASVSIEHGQFYAERADP